MIMQRGLVQRALGSCQNRVSLHRLPTAGPRLRESPSRPASRDGETSDEINSRRLSESEAVAARVEYVEDVSSLHAVLDATRDMLVVLDIQGETLCETGFDEPELHWKGDQRLVAAKQQAACENVRHTFARVARECPDVKFLEIDVEDGPGGDAVKAQLGVKVLPTIQFYKNRQLLWQQQGYMGLEAQLGEGVLYYDGSAANGVHVNDHVADLVTRQALDQFVAQGLDDASLRVVNVATRICQPCIKVFPAVLALARNFQGLVQFARFLGDESDEAEEVMHELGIVEVPTFIFYRHGQEVGRHVGSSRADLIGKVLELQSAAGMAVPEPLGVKPRGSRSKRAAYRP
ncbi:plastidic thioredoxin-like protein [Haematococcus lacustris]